MYSLIYFYVYALLPGWKFRFFYVFGYHSVFCTLMNRAEQSSVPEIILVLQTHEDLYFFLSSIMHLSRKGRRFIA